MRVLVPSAAVFGDVTQRSPKEEERCVTSQQTAADQTIQVMTDIPVMGLSYSYPCNPSPITYQEGDGGKEAINNDNKEEAEKKRKTKTRNTES